MSHLEQREIEDSERNADPFDVAANLTDNFNQERIAAVRLGAGPQRKFVADKWVYQVKRPDGTFPFPDCGECGEPIPEGRLDMGRILCVDCQELVETA